MVISRIRHHVETHNWFAVFIDFLIVVAGIVIGTQVNNWNQERIERNQGAEYRERLIAELLSNDAHNQNRKQYWEAVRKHAESTLAGVEGRSNDDRRLLIDAYQASQILTSQAKRFTYDELISTGRMEHVGDARLRNEIAGYYAAQEAFGSIFNAVVPYREYLREMMPSAAQQAVRSQCSEIIYQGPDGTPFNQLPDKCSIGLASQIAESAASEVRRDPAIGGHLNRLIADLDVKLFLLQGMNDHSRRLRTKIESAQRDSG